MIEAESYLGTDLRYLYSARMVFVRLNYVFASPSHSDDDVGSRFGTSDHNRLRKRSIVRSIDLRNLTVGQVGLFATR